MPHPQRLSAVWSAHPEDATRPRRRRRRREDGSPSRRSPSEPPSASRGRVRVHHPLLARQAAAEILLDRRQRDVDDRRVEAARGPTRGWSRRARSDCGVHSPSGVSNGSRDGRACARRPTSGSVSDRRPLLGLLAVCLLLAAVANLRATRSISMRARDAQVAELERGGRCGAVAGRRAHARASSALAGRVAGVRAHHCAAARPGSRRSQRASSAASSTVETPTSTGSGFAAWRDERRDLPRDRVPRRRGHGSAARSPSRARAARGAARSPASTRSTILALIRISGAARRKRSRCGRPPGPRRRTPATQLRCSSAARLRAVERHGHERGGRELDRVNEAVHCQKPTRQPKRPATRRGPVSTGPPVVRPRLRRRRRLQLQRLRARIRHVCAKLRAC